MARYAIGKLYKPCKTDSEKDLSPAGEELKGTIGGLAPVNFITVATPHLGSRGNKQVILFYFVINRVFPFFMTEKLRIMHYRIFNLNSDVLK